MTSGTTKGLRSIAYGCILPACTHSISTFVTVGESGTILTSSDGKTWTSQTSPTSKKLGGISLKYSIPKFK
jgi:hypothetical protein